MYKYGMRLRPCGLGCQPKDMKDWEDTDKQTTGYWSYIYYDRELTQEELYKYELDFIYKEV